MVPEKPQNRRRPHETLPVISEGCQNASTPSCYQTNSILLCNGFDIIQRAGTKPSDQVLIPHFYVCPKGKHRIPLPFSAFETTTVNGPATNLMPTKIGRDWTRWIWVPTGLPWGRTRQAALRTSQPSPAEDPA